MQVHQIDERLSLSIYLEAIPSLLTAVTLFAILLILSGCGRSQSSSSQKPPVDTPASSAELPTPADDQAHQDEQPIDAAEPPAVAAAEHATKATGGQLYLRYCAACHGEKGDGKGVAAAFLFPKPRDFRSGKFRLVSSKNNVPTDEDLDSVLARGMPGSSMPPWEHLSENERRLLAEEVRRFTREGIQEQYVRVLKEEEELTDDEIKQPDIQAEMNELVRSRTTPGETTEVPKFGTPNEAAVARGREIYNKLSCHSCHGKEGKGDGVEKQFDDEGFPTRPRDYTKGIFKGGHDPASLYRRIAYGMPGTPMPSTPANFASADQIADLVHFLRSLSTEKARQGAILKREQLLAHRVAKAPDSPDSAEWSKVDSVAVRTVPLWWRDDADTNLQVQAAHDGTTLAMRLTWSDATSDTSASRADVFEDMVAVQLSPSGSEPFLGMGSADTIVDLWQWRAGVKDDGAADHLMDDYPFDTDVYRNLLGANELPDFLTARVGGNPLAMRQRDGSVLGGKGPGSVTFRPPASQRVTAKSQWKEGRWCVVLTRPLTVQEEEGLKLAAEADYSVAYAVWDGSKRDRASQKVISIWNDLALE